MRPGFGQLSGEDQSTLPFLAAGGNGSISVTANVASALCARLHEAWRDGRLADAAAAHRRLMPLHDVLFAATALEGLPSCATVPEESLPSWRYRIDISCGSRTSFEEAT